MVDKGIRKRLLMNRLSELSDRGLYIRAAVYVAALAARCEDENNVCEAMEELEHMGRLVVEQGKSEEEPWRKYGS